MKTKEELNKIKEEYIELNKKLAELTDDELKMIVGGTAPEEHNIMLATGGAISPNGFTPVIEPCVFEPNSAQQGGAIYQPNNN